MREYIQEAMSEGEDVPVEPVSDLKLAETRPPIEGEPNQDSWSETIAKTEAAAGISDDETSVTNESLSKEQHSTEDFAAEQPAGDSDDDFGDFDEFGEFGEEPAVVSQDSQDDNNMNQSSASTFIQNPQASPAPMGPKPLKSSEIQRMSAEEIRRLLTPPPSIVNEKPHTEQDNTSDDGTTSTSQALWHHLTERTWMPLPKWEGSPIHKQLVVHLGIPLNLDASLPKSANNTRGNLSLPTQNRNYEVEGLQHLPNWSLSMVSNEALESMSEDELVSHTSKLDSILSEARKLKDAMESKEMDLVGEKNILEGMVESLLVFSQRKQRERLKKKVNKN